MEGGQGVKRTKKMAHEFEKKIQYLARLSIGKPFIRLNWSWKIKSEIFAIFRLLDYIHISSNTVSYPYWEKISLNTLELKKYEFHV